MKRRTCALLLLAAACGSPPADPSMTPATLPPPPAPAQVIERAFADESYWNTPLSEDAPIDPDSDAMIGFLRRDATHDHIRLTGTGPSGRWGMPIYHAGRDDPVHTVSSSCGSPLPPELEALRIPDDAQPDPTSDAAMVVYDHPQGIAVGLWRAEFNGAWSACGGSVAYLASNGLDGSLPASDEPRNQGHRGIPPPVWAVRWGEIRHGEIPHVLKIAVNTSRCSYRFPMVGDECGTWARFAPPEGTHIRIKPEVDLTQLGLDPAALIIARSLQRYGAVIGDQSGGPVTLKVENRVASTGSNPWHGVLHPDSLAPIPLSSYEVLAPADTSWPTS